MAITVKHKFVSTIPDSDDASVVRPSNWNDDHDLTGTIPVANGGTGASTASGGLNNLLPSQTGNNGKVLATDGTNATWTTNGSGDVVGPSSATDNAIARFDTTTGKLIKNSGVTVDDNNNISANALDDGYINTAASGTLITLTAASVRRYTITGSGGQTIKLPNATTLTNGTVFQFDNNQSSGAITVNNNSNTLVVSVPSGGFVLVNLLSNATAAGSWDRHDQAPANVSWSTNTFDYAGSITSATWNGNTVAVNRGGTGQSTYTDGQLLIGNSTGNTLTKSTLTAGTGISVTNSAGAITIANTSPSSGGTVTSVGGTGTVSGISLSGTVTSSGNLTLGGALDLSSPPTIGNTAPNTGAFTTLNSTGGALNGTIGATTPAAGTFTTITGQTGRLNGTGSNLITYSQLIGGTLWTLNGTATAATNSSGTTDPLGGNTASLISNATDVLYNGNCIYKAVIPVISSTPYTISCYIKFGTATTASIATRDNQSGTVSSVTTTTASGWTRISTTITTGSTTSAISMEIGGANGTFYAWGAQCEIGSTANSYVATTTTAVYGTPTLSFSGVAGLGLQSDGSLYVSPAGTGALQAQATTSSTVGGNARGANAVDWQTSRNAASQVANGSYSVLSGGDRNTVSGFNAVVSGGFSGTASNTYTFVGSGASNQATGYGSSVVAGYTNIAAGYWNFIGNGFSNSGTSGSAVTTQSGTMNATTAVTLSGSNANIKVGQLVTGTSINSFPNTYVAAISGTSLTLSQAASGSSTSTLSFYTPHGVVVGGGNNQATGSYSFIGGGGDAGTAGNRNLASGDWSVVVGGRANQATGIASFVGGGGFEGTNIGNNIASGVCSSTLGGFGNNASGAGAAIIGGFQHLANSSQSSVLGGRRGTTRSIVGNTVIPACENPIADAGGVSQTALLVLATQTTDATATVLRSNSSAASGTNQVILPNNSAYYFKGSVVAGVTGAGNTKGWTIEGVIKRGAGVGTTTLVGVTVMSSYADVGAATWTIGVTADTTNGGLAVTATGQASTTIRWVCKVETTEMTY